MTATNHIATGAVIASIFPSAAIALPLALFSHIILDVVPHYGNPSLSLASRKFQIILITDVVLLLAFMLFALVTMPNDWLYLLSVGFVAASPDLLHVPSWLSAKYGKPYKHNKLNQFLIDIQRYERPWGIYIEIFWLALMLFIFSYINFI